MTAEWTRVPYHVLGRISIRITSDVRVTYPEFGGGSAPWIPTGWLASVR